MLNQKCQFHLPGHLESQERLPLVSESWLDRCGLTPPLLPAAQKEGALLQVRDEGSQTRSLQGTRLGHGLE